MADERVRLILDIEGVTDAKALQEAIKELADAMGATSAQCQNVSAAATSAGQSVNNMAQQTTQAASTTAAATQAATQATVASATQATAAMSNVTQAVTQTVTATGQATAQFASQVTNTATAAAAALNNVAAAAAGGGTGAAGGGGAGRGGGGSAAGGQSGTSSGGGRGMNAAQAMLMLGYALEDAQYGIRGILNNIPLLLMSLGVGPGLTGVIQILVVVMNQLYEKFGHMFTSLEKWKPTVESLVDPTKKWSEQIELAQKYLEKLGKDTNMSVESLEKYRNTLERIKQMEAELKAQRDAAKAADEVAADKGDIADERLRSRKQAFDDIVTDPGRGQSVLDSIKNILTKQESNRLSGLSDSDWDNEIKRMMKDDAGVRAAFQKQLALEIRKIKGPDSLGKADTPITEEQQKQAEKDALSSVNVRSVAQSRALFKANEGGAAWAKDIIGRMKSANTEEQFDEAFQQLAALMPDLANEIRNQLLFTKMLEFEEKAEAKNVGKFRERKAREAEFDRTVQGPGMGMSMTEIDRANAIAREGAQFFENRDKRIEREKAAEAANKQRNAAADAALEPVFRRVNDIMTQAGTDPLTLYTQAVNSGRTNEQKQQALQRQRAAISQQLQQQGLTQAQADVASNEILKSGQQASDALRNLGHVTVNSFGQLAWQSRYNAQQIQAIMRQMQFGIRTPAAQFGLRAR